MERGSEVFANEYIFGDSEPAEFLDALRGVEKNVTQLQPRDRSAELIGRQQCEAGYGYCASKLSLPLLILQGMLD